MTVLLTPNQEMRAIRKRLGWRQSDMAYALGTTAAIVSGWENNRARPGYGHLYLARYVYQARSSVPLPQPSDLADVDGTNTTDGNP